QCSIVMMVGSCVATVARAAADGRVAVGRGCCFGGGFFSGGACSSQDFGFLARRAPSGGFGVTRARHDGVSCTARNWRGSRAWLASAPSAAPRCASPTGASARHEPEKTALHLVVREHLETFLATVSEERGRALPRYVEEELRRYLRCGILAHGFVRVACR